MGHYYIRPRAYGSTLTGNSEARVHTDPTETRAQSHIKGFQRTHQAKPGVGVEAEGLETNECRLTQQRAGRPKQRDAKDRGASISLCPWKRLRMAPKVETSADSVYKGDASNLGAVYSGSDSDAPGSFERPSASWLSARIFR